MTQSRHAWICRRVLSPAQIAAGEDLGLAAYVVDKKSGIVTVQSSLALEAIGEMYDTAIEAGAPIQAPQVYPRLHKVTMHQLRQDQDSIEYQVTIESSTAPVSTERLELTVDKSTLRTSPYSPMSPMVAARAEWSRQRNGTWPVTDIFEV